MGPFVILGEDTPVLIHDNLDSNLVWHTNLVQSGRIFGSMDSTIPQVMNGLPRNCMESEFSFILLFFYLLPPFAAYTLNLTLMHFVAFFGMYLLLSRHIVKEKEYNFITIGASLCFALLPFWPFGGLSIAGMPLALYAFLNIRNRASSHKDWLILCILPFYSSMALSFFFFLVMMGGLWLTDFLRKKDANPYFFGAICLMTGIFMLVEYRLVYGMFFDSGYVSHRIERLYPVNAVCGAQRGYGFTGCINNAGNNFISGQFHAVSLHTFWIGLSILTSLGLVYLKSVRKKLKDSNQLSYPVFFETGSIFLVLFLKQWTVTYITRIWGVITLLMGLFLLQRIYKYFLNIKLKGLNEKRPVEEPVPGSFSNEYSSEPDMKLFITLLFLCFVLSIIYGFWKWNALSPIKEQVMILNTFDFSRFNFLHPLLWYIIFAMSLKIITENSKQGKHLVIVLLLLQAGYLFSFFDSCLYQPGGTGLLKSEQLTYEEFYSPELFNEIAAYIGEPQENYRVASIGIDPSVSQYNGFYSLDSYQDNYPLEYKHKFRKLIEGELEKDREIQEFFDYWGSRCCVYTAEYKINTVVTKDKSAPITDLEFNTEAFKEMGGRYIISTVEIKNHKENNLKFRRTFEDEKSPWKIWLYEVS